MLQTYLELSLYWLLSWAIYKILLSRLSFFGLNRLVLLSCILIPIVLILLPPVTFSPPAQFMGDIRIKLPEIIVGSTAKKNVFFSWEIIYSAGVLIAAWLWLRAIMQVYSIIRNAKRYSAYGLEIYTLNKAYVPFTFLNKIFLPEGLIDSEDAHIIIQHEKAHINKMHYIDLLLISLLRVIFPFHPALWLLGKELKATHEYEIDHEMKKYINPESYAKLLVRIAGKYSVNSGLLTHAIYSQSIKSRIMMLFTQTGKIHLSRYLILPLSLFVVFVLQGQSKKAIEKYPIANDIRIDTIQVFNNTTGKEETKIVQSGGEFYLKTEKDPVFPGGTPELFKFIAGALVYPEVAKKKGIETTCIVELKIHDDGLPEIKNISGKNHEYFTDCINNIMAKMPNWIPGQVDQKNVTSIVTLPIKFKLE